MSHTKVGATPIKHYNRNDGTYLDKENLLGVIESLMGPVAYIVSLWAVAYHFQGRIDSAILLLTILVFPLVYPDRTSLEKSIYAAVINLTVNFIFTVAILLATGLVTGYIAAIDKSVLYSWALTAPVTNLGIYLVLRSSAKSLLKINGPKRRGIIIGMNAQGIVLAKKIEKSLLKNRDCWIFRQPATAQGHACKPVQAHWGNGKLGHYHQSQQYTGYLFIFTHGFTAQNTSNSGHLKRHYCVYLLCAGHVHDGPNSRTFKPCLRNSSHIRMRDTL